MIFAASGNATIALKKFLNWSIVGFLQHVWTFFFVLQNLPVAWKGLVLTPNFAKIQNLQILALKTVRVDGRGEQAEALLDNYWNEIELLRKLQGSPFIINLAGAEVRTVCISTKRLALSVEFEQWWQRCRIWPLRSAPVGQFMVPVLRWKLLDDWYIYIPPCRKDPT